MFGDQIAPTIAIAIIRKMRGKHTLAVSKSHWIVITVSKHVVTEQTLTSGSKGISVDKTTNLGVVITALEVIQPGFLVTLLTTGRQMACVSSGVAGGRGAHRQFTELFSMMIVLLFASDFAQGKGVTFYTSVCLQLSTKWLSIFK
jgi:hypothetical protein